MNYFWTFSKNVKHTRNSIEFLTAFVSILFYSMRRAIVMNLSENIVLFFLLVFFLSSPNSGSGYEADENKKKMKQKTANKMNRDGREFIIISSHLVD